MPINYRTFVMPFNPLVSAQEVHEMFKAFKATKTRTRALPNESHCIPIANATNEFFTRLKSSVRAETAAAPAQFDAASIRGMNLEDIQFHNESVRQAAVRLLSELETYLVRLGEILNSPDQKFDPQHLDLASDALENASALSSAVGQWINEEGKGGRRTSNRSLSLIDRSFIKHIRPVIEKSLKDAGQSDVSGTSEKGAVLFVVSELLVKTTGKRHSASALSRRIRRQKQSR